MAPSLRHPRRAGRAERVTVTGRPRRKVIPTRLPARKRLHRHPELSSAQHRTPCYGSLPKDRAGDRRTPYWRLSRAQAPPATLAERHGRRGSQATWSRTLPFPAAVPAGCGPLRGKPACDLLWRLADGDGLMGVQLGLMGVQLGGKVIWAGLRGCGCGSGTAAPSDTLAQSSDLRRRLCARSHEESEQLVFAGQDHGGSSRVQISERYHPEIPR